MKLEMGCLQNQVRNFC